MLPFSKSRLTDIGKPIILYFSAPLFLGNRSIFVYSFLVIDYVWILTLLFKNVTSFFCFNVKLSLGVDFNLVYRNLSRNFQMSTFSAKMYDSQWLHSHLLLTLVIKPFHRALIRTNTSTIEQTRPGAVRSRFTAHFPDRRFQVSETSC